MPRMNRWKLAMGEDGCLFDEMGNLVRLAERPGTDARAGLTSQGWRGK